MSSWRHIRQSYAALINDMQRSPGEARVHWDTFAENCRVAPVPNHLAPIVDATNGDKRLAILDHGCGNGLNVLYLRERGYVRVAGVDLSGRGALFSAINDFLIDQGLADAPVLHAYDGKVTSFENASFDLIFSNQVIEHLSDADFAAYFAEEKRLLTSGGAAIHEFPHRGMIYDGHLRTYLLHMLPDGLLRSVLAAVGSDRHAIVGNGLHLRYYGDVERRIRGYFVGIEDRTLSRLQRATDYADYEGSVALRRLFAGLVRVPGLGAFLSKLVIRTVLARAA